MSSRNAAYVVRLPVQNLLDEVVEDEAMASGEGIDEPGDVFGPVAGARMGPGRQAGQLQPGRPPLGARLERGHECGLQPEPHHLVEEHLRLVGGEPEVRGPHLRRARRAHADATAGAAGRPEWSSPA